MKRLPLINKILYMINPKKSLNDFLSEAENIVVNYEKSPLDSIFSSYGTKVCSKAKNKTSSKKPATVLYMIIFSIVFLAGYLVLRYM